MTTASLTAGPLAPTATEERIQAIDAVRGFALLGILCVNIQSFAEPFGAFMLPEPPAGSSWADVASFYFVKVFCESKFYPLFAMLFGFGLMMQADRARRRGVSYWGAGLRRYVFLTFLGLLHALLLWFGDILFLYGIGGLFLLLMHRANTKALAITGGVFLFIAVALMTVFSYFSTPGKAGVTGAGEATPTPVATAPASAAPKEEAGDGGVSPSSDGAEKPEPGEPAAMPPSEAEGRVIGDGRFGEFETPVMRLFKAMEQGAGDGGPSNPTWMEFERQAYTSGRAVDRLLFNAFNWVMFLMICLVGFGWDVLAMLLLGAVLYRVGLFDPARSGRLWKLLWAGVLLGMPMCVVGAVAAKFMAPNVAAAVFSGCSMLFGPLVSLAYLSGIALLVNSGTARVATGALANVGRLALTNYLMQTVVCSFLFYEWGLHLYEQTTRGQRMGIVAAVFAAQLVFSAAYFKVFKMGPMEWLWRSVTYLRRPGVGAS